MARKTPLGTVGSEITWVGIEEVSENNGRPTLLKEGRLMAKEVQAEDTASLDEVVHLLTEQRIRAEVESLARGRIDQRRKIMEWGKELLSSGGITTTDLQRYIREVTHRDVSITTIRSLFRPKKQTHGVKTTASSKGKARLPSDLKSEKKK